MKKIRALAFLAAILIIISSCGTVNTNLVSDADKITDYKEIPGITDYEIGAIESLKATRSSFSYGHITETEAFMLPDQSFSGFTYKLCGVLSDLFGIDFIPEYITSWDILITAFNDKSIDFIGDLTATQERMQTYYMSHAIAERSLRVFVREGSNIRTESDLSGLKVGFIENTITLESVRKAYTIDFESVLVRDNEDAAEMLKTGELDAFVNEAVIDPYFEKYSFIKSMEFFPLIYTPVSISSANPELEPVISVINKYLVSGGIDNFYALYKQGDYEYNKNKLCKSFTQEEKDYLEDLSAQNKKVTLALEHDNYPVCFYNEKEDEFQGISVDVINEISKLSGIEFEVMTDKNTTWAEIMDKLQRGEISMVSQLLYSDVRKNNFLWSEIPYSTSHYALISSSDYPDMSIYQVIRTKVGNISKTAFEDMYNEWFPGSSNAIAYETQNQALGALEKGEIDLLMASEYILLTELNYREKPGYKINILFNQPMDSLFGFNKDERVLCSIVNKTQAYVKTSGIARSWENRVFDYSMKLANQRNIYLTVFTVFLLLILVAVSLLFYKNKALSHDLKRQTEEAKVASKAKGAFLAHMSHEIRTPLNAVIGMSAIAKNSINDTAKAVSAIDVIIKSSNHLLGILNNVLDMSKIESGKLELLNSPFNLAETLSEVYDIIQLRCKEKNISFQVDTGGISGTLTLIGDKLRLSQVLINLLGNAVKFTDDNGEILLKMHILSESGEEIFLKFTVSDNGIGMSEKEIERLFIPFEQADSLTSVKYGGTGLGLSISRSIVQMMGGDIKVNSKPGAGSSFCFELHMRKGVLESSVPDSMESIELIGKSILLAEDIEINCVIIEEILSPTGVNLQTAGDGKKAFEAFRDSPEGYFDLIFMDIQMPMMNGYEAARAIRGLERKDAAKIPIIAMTANAYKEDIDSALEAGMDGHLAKPINTGELLRVLAEYLNR